MAVTVRWRRPACMLRKHADIALHRPLSDEGIPHGPEHHLKEPWISRRAAERNFRLLQYAVCSAFFIPFMLIRITEKTSPMKDSLPPHGISRWRPSRRYVCGKWIQLNILCKEHKSSSQQETYLPEKTRQRIRERKLCHEQ